MKKTKGSQILLPRIGVLDFSLLVRQLKHKGFICNIFNCLNEENKRFTNSFFIFLFIFSCFPFILFGMHLIDILVKKTKGLSTFLYFSFYLLLLSLYISM
jgi:hypothetical protein